MLVSKLTCPNCKTVLKPAKPLPAGKKVKCPKCSTDFTADEGDANKIDAAKTLAAAAAAAAPGGAKKKADKPAEKKPEPKELTEEEESAGVYNILAADRPKLGIEDDEEEDEDEDKGKDGKVDFVPDHSIKDLRGPAQSAVIRPSNLLIANGVVGFFGWVILFILLIIPVVFPTLDDDENTKDAMAKPTLIIPPGLMALGTFNPAGGGNAGGNVFQSAQTQKKPLKPEEKRNTIYLVYTLDLSTMSNYQWYLFALCLSPIFLGMVYSCLMTWGAVHMQNLQSRTWGIVSSSMCMFPYATLGFVTVCSMVITLVVGMVADEPITVLIVLIAFWVLEAIGCVLIGVYGLTTLMRPDVIDGYEYVPDL
jgi:predicted Zn finger-like uncharacterized protein